MTDAEELELLELEKEQAQHQLNLGEGQTTGIRATYPSEKFAQYAEPITQFAGMFAKTPFIGPAIAGAATMGAEIGRQGIQAFNSEPGTPKTWTESGKRIASAFGRGAGGELLARGVFAGANAAFPKLIPTLAQGMKVSAGISEQVGKRVLNEPARLSTALPVEEAGKIYGNALESVGLKQGPEITMETMGKQALGTQEATHYAYDAIQRMGKGELPYQDALVARDQLKTILNMPKWQNPNLAQNESFLMKMRDTLDNYLEPYFKEGGQSFESARQGYSAAMDKKAFSSWLPQNANKSASVLRGTLAATAAGAGLGGYVSPETAVTGIALASPRMLGYGIRSAASPITREAVKFGTRLATQTIADKVLPSSTEELMRRKYEAQK